MADRLIQTGTLTDIADAIRAKTGKSATMTPLEMPEEIASIETGGGTIDPADLPQLVQDAGINATFRFGSDQSYDVVVTGDELYGSEFYQGSGSLTNVKTIRFLGSPSQIPDRYLYGQDALEEITIPESVNNIRQAFSECSNLRKVKILNKNVNIVDNAFQSCPSLLTAGVGSQYNIELPEGITIFPSFRFSKLEEVVIPEGVTQFISFYQCYNLRSITLPTTLRTAGSLYQCSSLLEVIAPSVTNTINVSLCTSLQNAYFPKAQTMLGENCLQNCTSLRTIQIGSVSFPITSSRNTCMTGCTQSNLTITLYSSNPTNHPIATLLANVRNGAKNATIIIKAAANMEYNGVQYDADDVILTSTP